MATQNPPPPTIPGVRVVKQSETPKEKADVTVQILMDGVGISKEGTAGTDIDPSGVVFTTPEAETNDKGVVTSVGQTQIIGVMKIQTKYASGAKATNTSAYGRGTTDADIAAGNTSLGFHESCHRDDYLTFLKNNPLPSFTGAPGMTTGQYNDAKQKFSDDQDAFYAAMDAYTEKQTDEVGYKKSEYDAKGPRKT